MPGLGDLVAVNDETVFQCLAAWLPFIIMQAAVELGDVKSSGWEWEWDGTLVLHIFVPLGICFIWHEGVSVGYGVTYNHENVELKQEQKAVWRG